MDTKKLRALMMAIEKKSMAQAAAELSYTPSALSHMTDMIEQTLGVKIISRTPSGVFLTREGEELYDRIQAVIDAEDRLFAVAKQLSSERSHELKIGSYSSISRSILPEILKQFKDRHPEIRVSITVRDKLYPLLKSGSVDVIFGDEIALRDAKVVHRIPDPFVAVVPEGLFEDRDSVTPEDLYPFAYISTNQSILRKYFEESKFRELIRFDSEDDEPVISMVREGIAITVIPRLFIGDDVKGVKILKLVPEVSRQLGFAFSTVDGVASETYATKAFHAFLKTADLF